MPLLILAAALALPPAGKPSQAAPGQRIADAFSAALRSRDYGWCERHLATGFVYRGQKGDRQDRDWMLGRLRSWFHPLAYHVEATLSLVSARRVKQGLVLVSDLTVRSQLFGLGRMPLTQTTLRGESVWRSQDGEWVCDRITEIVSHKTVDGAPVSDP